MGKLKKSTALKSLLSKLVHALKKPPPKRTDYPATVSILATCIILLCATSRYPALMEVLCFSTDSLVNLLLGAITYQLLHAGPGHLVGNFVFGLPFMLFLEHKLGSRSFATFFFACGVGSALCHVFIMGPGSLVGASGSIMGCMAGASMLYGQHKVEKVLGALFMSLLLLSKMSVGIQGVVLGSPIAHWGHVGGCVTALILVSLTHQGKK